jgi:hypothetical protein
MGQAMGNCILSLLGPYMSPTEFMFFFIFSFVLMLSLKLLLVTFFKTTVYLIIPPPLHY